MFIVNLDGVIGQDLTAEDLRAELETAGFDDVRLDMNCPGGSVFEGLAMRQAILDHPGTVTARVVSLAASMATALLTACSSIEVYTDSTYMIHRVSGLTLGNAEDHTKMADILENLDQILAEHYAIQSGKTVDECLKLMTAETWYYGREIVSEGFADTFTTRDTRKTKAAALAEARSRFAACYRQPQGEETMRIAALLRNTNGSGEPMDPGLKAELDAWDRLYSKTPNHRSTRDDIPADVEKEARAWESLYDPSTPTQATPETKDSPEDIEATCRAWESLYSKGGSNHGQ